MRNWKFGFIAVLVFVGLTALGITFLELESGNNYEDNSALRIESSKSVESEVKAMSQADSTLESSRELENSETLNVTQIMEFTLVII